MMTYISKQHQRFIFSVFLIKSGSGKSEKSQHVLFFYRTKKCYKTEQSLLRLTIVTSYTYSYVVTDTLPHCYASFKQLCYGTVVASFLSSWIKIFVT